MLAPLLLAADLFFAYGPYDPAVPKPESILGYGAGERHTVYMDQERVVQGIVAKAGARARIFPYGKTWEGRPLRVVALSSPENLRRLDQIRADMQTLADGTLDAAKIEKTPVIVWINETIHGNETASFESGMWLLYNLAASRNPEVVKALDDAVVILNPCYNPDGHERAVVWYNSIATGSPDPNAFEQREPWVINGRGNHYRFDMNRDRLSMSQVETRSEVAEFLRWNPQVYVDQHGQVETYFFPPTAMSVNANIRDRYNRWTEVFGKATARSFDQNGFNYYVKDQFDFYAPVYLDSWTSLTGAIGMTHETNASQLARRDADGAVRTLRDGMERHFVAALAVIRSAAENREALVRSYAEFRTKNAQGGVSKGKFLVASGTEDAIGRLASILDGSKIRYERGVGSASVEGESFWSAKREKATAEGAWLIVPMAQPQATVVKALCETESDFEREFVAEQLRRRKARDEDSEYAEGEEFYDLTGWSLPLLVGVDAWWSDSAPAIRTLGDRTASSAQPRVGWAALPGEANTLAALRLLRSGVRVSLTTAPMKISGKSYPRGTYLVLRSRNDANVAEKIKGFGEPLDSAYPEDGRWSPGSEAVQRLRAGDLAILFGDSSSPTSFGGAWYVFEKALRIPFTPLSSSGLRGNLDRFSAILAPEGSVDLSAPKLKEWVNDGGCLVLLGGDPGRGGYLKLERQKAVAEPGNVPGSLFRAEVDPRSFLSYGYRPDGDGRIRLAAFVTGTSFYSASGDGSVWTIPSSNDRPLISGWAWPDETEKAVRGTVWCHTSRVGSGRVVWFAQDPTERAMYQGVWPMLLNAIVMGPSP